MIYSDFNTFNDVSMGVYPLLSQWSNTFTPYAKLSSFSYGPYNFVVLCFLQSGQSVPIFLFFETVLQKWYRWEVSANTTGPQCSFVYEHPETGYRGLFYTESSASNTYTRLFDPAYTTDDSNVINWSVQTAWTSLSDPLAFKTINEIEPITDESSLRIEVYGANTQADFDVVTLPTNSTFKGVRTTTACPLGPLKTYWAGIPTNARYYSLKFYSFLSGTAGSLPPEVLSHFIIEHFPMSRF
jgi:hypothetical protein